LKIKSLAAKAAAVGAGVLGLVGVAGAQAPASVVPITSSTLTAALSYVTSLFNDLQPFIVLVLGVPIAIWLISLAVGFVRRFARTGGGRRL
jgi:hypothetical protein